MTRNELRTLAVGLAVTLAMATLQILSASPAQAHPAGWYYTGPKWPTGATVSYGLNSGFPGGAPRSRIVDAKNQWMQYTNTAAEPRIYWTLADDVYYGYYANPCSMSSGNNTVIVHWNDLDFSSNPTAAGLTTRCASGSTLTKVSIAMDISQPWYTGTGDAPPGQLDMWSTASHEWGHALGHVVHFNEQEAGVCPLWENSVRHTMCPSTVAGYETQRHPKTHDIHTFQGAY